MLVGKMLLSVQIRQSAGHSQYVQKLMAAGKFGDSWMVIALFTANAHPIFTKPDSCWNRRATLMFLREIGKLVP
jgi:hypothetical protein